MAIRFVRWDRALKQCMQGKTVNRWNSDPLTLNEEAHQLPPDKQRIALDMAQEAPPHLRAFLAPMWQYCFVQWHVYDAGLEAEAKGAPLQGIFEDKEFLSDLTSLQVSFQNGDLDKAATGEKWMWKLLEPFEEAGSVQPFSKEAIAAMMKVGREERKEGVRAYADGRFDKAVWHSWQGLKLTAGAPADYEGPLLKLRGDLFKNQAAAALKVGLKRTALAAADEALAIDNTDEKAWFRRYCALEALGQAEEAVQSLKKAGLEPKPQPTVEAAGKSSPSKQAKASKKARDFDDRELDPDLHSSFGKMVFAEIGIDSIAAVDMIRYIQAELPETSIPLTLVYDKPCVEEAVSEILSKLNASSDPFLRRKMVGTFWRAVSNALGRDPLKHSTGPRSWPSLSEEEAVEILQLLREAFESVDWLEITRSAARQTGFEQRAFLVSIRQKALLFQRHVLEAQNLAVDNDGVRQLECALVNVARTSPRVTELLRAARVALHGGPNGMWAINVEPDDYERWSDVRSMQTRSLYIKADPFGPDRINTNSAHFQQPVAAL